MFYIYLFVFSQSKWRGYICRKKFSNIVESIQKKLQIVKMSHGDSGISGNERLIELFEKSINCCVHDTFKLKKFKTLWLTFRNLGKCFGTYSTLTQSMHCML